MAVEGGMFVMRSRFLIRLWPPGHTPNPC